MSEKAIILCADDFAQNEAVTEGILRLLAIGRLTAVSCMTDSPRWHPDAARLKAHEGQADIGLHFNLTHDFGQPAWPLSHLMQAGWRRQPDAKRIEASLSRQLDRFEAAMGRAPDFVDGHQHVHAFPRLRSIVHKVLAERYRDRLPYLRSVALCGWNHDAPLKEAVLRALTRGTDREAAAAGFAFPRGFGGLYSLSPLADYGKHMKNWLEKAEDGTLLMCHPGLMGPANDDEIAAVRPKELAYLESDAFAQALRQSGARLTRFKPA